MNFRMLPSSLLVAFLIFTSSLFATDRFVPGDYTTIQAAIDAADNGDTVIVAAGTYTGDGNRDIDFKGKAITVRSACGPENCIIDCQNALGHRGFYFHNGEDANSILHGFTVRGGRSLMGGGINCTGSSPTIERCVIVDNLAVPDYDHYLEAHGGGICCISNSNPIITSCTIRGNEARGGDGYDFGIAGGFARGGGIYVSPDSHALIGPASHALIEGCQIAENSARGGVGNDMCGSALNGFALGGGIYGNATVSNSLISANIAAAGSGGRNLGGWAGGGGIFGVVAIENSLIIGNSAVGGSNEGEMGGDAYGGGICAEVHLDSDDMYVTYGPSTVSNCTISDNSAEGGDPKGFGIGGGIDDGSRGSTISNTILWGNGADRGQEISGNPSVSYGDVQGGYPGIGNIDADPCFVAGPLGDYYLSQVSAGQAVDSPCVDAGSDSAANLGLDEFTTRTDQGSDEGVVDMGYHYPVPISADIDRDWDVDFCDYAILAEQWQGPPGVPSADVTPPGGNGIVDKDDLALLVQYWLWSK